jgi:hypothetical protein
MDRTEPAEPIDKMEPEDPIDRIDPVEPIDKIDPDEPMLMIDPEEPRLRETSVAFFIRPLWQAGPQEAAAWRCLPGRCAALLTWPLRGAAYLAAARRARPSTKMSIRISNRSSGSEKANSPARSVMFGNCSGGSEAM